MAYPWLPALVEKDYFDTDQEWIDAVYAVFKRDFLENIQEYQGKKIVAKKLPQYDGLFEGKNGTFRHLVTEGNDEANRQLIWNRADRLAWLLPILLKAGTHEVREWRNHRKNSGYARMIALSDFSYVIVLAERQNKTTGEEYLLLWAAYPIEHEHRRRSLRKEYEAFTEAEKD